MAEFLIKKDSSIISTVFPSDICHVYGDDPITEGFFFSNVRGYYYSPSTDCVFLIESKLGFNLFAQILDVQDEKPEDNNALQVSINPERYVMLK